MQKCITSRWFEQQANVTKTLGVVMGIALGVIGLIVLITNKNSRIEAVACCLLLMMIGILIYGYTFVLYIIDTRTFSLGPEGIIIQYANSYVKQYSWNDVSSIVVCDVFHASKDPQIYEHVIRFAIGEEVEGPYSGTKQWSLAGHAKWSTYEYYITHCQTVIAISYTSDRLEQVKLFSGKDIQQD